MSASMRNRAANPSTDYNDGNWHPWTGGDRPVHAKTDVDVLFSDGLTTEGLEAEDWDWSHDQGDANIVAFRVVEEFKEPRTFWGYFNDDADDWMMSESESYARLNHGDGKGYIIELQEVQR